MAKKRDKRKREQIKAGFKTYFRNNLHPFDHVDVKSCKVFERGA